MLLPFFLFAGRDGSFGDFVERFDEHRGGAAELTLAQCGGAGVHELADEAISQLFDGLPLRVGEIGARGERAGDLRVAQTVGVGINLFDQRADAAFAEPLLEAVDFVIEYFFAQRHLVDAILLIVGDDAAQRVHVVHIHAVEFFNRRVNVSGDGQVDHEQGLIVTLLLREFHAVGGDDGLGAAHSGDDQIGAGQFFVHPLVGHARAVTRIGQGAGVGEGAAGDGELAHIGAAQVLAEQLRHVAGPDDEDALAGQVGEDGLRDIDGDRGDRHFAGGDVGFAVDALGDGECVVEEAIEEAAGGALFAGLRVGGF